MKAVSHRNHVIIEKFLRVRLEILLHEPLKSTVEFTPLGSSKSLKFDVRYEKLPLYCECFGLVGHTSERFCSIPREKRTAIYPKNLSVDAYWKGQSSNRRALIFGGFPRDNKLQFVSDNNTPLGMDGAVVDVAKAVSGLTMSDKVAAASTKGAAQASLPRGQEGRAEGASTTALFGAAPGQRTGLWLKLHLLALAMRAKGWRLWWIPIWV